MTNQSVAKNSLYVNESPMVFFVGATPIFNFNFLGTGTLSSPVSTLYRNKEDVTSTKLTGSTTSTGRVVTTKKLTLDLAGSYELYVSVTDGSISRVVGLRILVRKLGVQ